MTIGVDKPILPITSTTTPTQFNTEGKIKIKTIKSQHRRDFHAIYVCEHCGHEKESYGYDDSHFHDNVIPAMKCESCGKTAADNYRPLATKYPDGMAV